MKMRKLTIALSGVALCAALSGCGRGNLGESPETNQEESPWEPAETVPEQEETISESRETTYHPDTEMEDSQTIFTELAGAYQQMALYIQEGFRVYHVEGEYQAYFGPIKGAASGMWVDGHYIGAGDEIDEEYFWCDILLEGEGEQWSEKLAFTYDPETDWYVFSSQYEPLFAGDTFWAEMEDSSYAAEVLADCVCQTVIARDADIAAPIRYDSEGGPMEKTLRMNRPWFFRGEGNGLSYQISPKVYYYWDDRLDVYIDIQYPQLDLEDDQKEMEEAINEKLREAFFYGYGWGEEDEPLDPSQEMYTNIERVYLITREDERYLSMRIHEYNDSRGANHPNEWETGITFDMRTGEVVCLEDVFGEDEMERLTLKDLLERGDFRCLWIWLPGGEGWIEELKEDKFYGDDSLRGYESKFYLTDTGFGLITSMYNEYTCLETDYEKLGIEGF